MNEAVFIFGMIGGLIAPFLLLTGRGRIFWVATMSTIGLVVLGFEALAKFTTGFTISRLFWLWSLQHETTAWIVLGLLFIGWLILLLHLAWKLLTRRFSKEK